jgi:very-short-patch-repair endonuclease
VITSPDPFGLRRQQLATSTQLRAAGVGRASLSRAVVAGDVVRVRRNVYAPSALDPLPRFVVTEKGVAPAYVRQVRAVMLSLGPKATACGRTAAALWGWGLFVEPGRTIEVAMPHGRGRSRLRGVVMRQRRRLPRIQYVAVTGTEPLWVTSAVCTVLDCCVLLPLVEAVVVCDSALRAGDVTLAELRQAVRRLPGVRDAQRAREVVRLADLESGSVLETVLRVRMRLAGIHGFSSQVTIQVAGGVLHRVDFCSEDRLLVIETDGAKWHPDPEPDRIRDNALVGVGFRVLRYTWADVVHDTPRVLAEIAAALAAGTTSIQCGAQAARLAA